jgi:alanine racemase
VLGYTPGWQGCEAAAGDITLTVFDPETAAELQRTVSAESAQQARPLTVHVKVNTGMNRLGVRPERAGELIQVLRSLPGLRVEGIFTHFATSDETDKAYTELQFARFQRLLDELARAGLRPPVAHAANSAALLTMPHTHLDMVRSGIALYGLDPDLEQCCLPTGFLPALSWKAMVTHVADLQAGEPVSYGREFVAGGPMRVAVIPVGYADGFPRKPHTWGSVLIRGEAAPIVGRVCMDQTVVDVTQTEAHNGPLRAGEEVVLIGHQGQAHVSAEMVSARLGTNNYDVVSRILARVPRLYVD